MMSKLLFHAGQAAERVDRFLTKHRLVFSALLTLVLSGALALDNVSSGPLSNLNDIGGWNNRALFIAMSAFVHASMLMLCVLLSRVSFSRTALRQVILTAGLYIMLLAINQKTYIYVNVMQPLVRAMDTGFGAGMQAQSFLSAPARLLVYSLTRGPVYDMYLLKLFAIGCYLLIALLMSRAADRAGLGIRVEVLLALCMILPQGFMNAACSALVEIAALALMGAALTLRFGCDKPKTVAASACYGAACALCGACLLALPAMIDRKNWKREAGVIAGVMLALCVPAVLGGMPIGDAAGSLFGAVLGMPVYAGGAPGAANLIPRAVVEEMAQYAPILRHLPGIDTLTYAQEHYTQTHYAYVMRGFAWAGVAAYAGVWALISRWKEKPALHRAFVLTLCALIVCPGVTSGAWLAADMLCLYAILAAPGLRIPACLVLFATAAGSCYPMTEEVLLPMVYAFVLCLLALCMLLNVIPMGREEESHD
ncbi:MAG: hypothetical protein E7321_00280 [Clostridiales bacterium]|nr:hypothetical protein [Clostridiales bacterium]